MNNINNETEKSNNSGLIPFILFICTIIVIANTKQSVFEDLDHGSYYNLILFSLICKTFTLGLLITFVKIITNNNWFIFNGWSIFNFLFLDS